MIDLKTSEIPEDILHKLEWLNELMPWTLLAGCLIERAEALFGWAEFTKPQEDQIRELSVLQYFAAINKQYEIEKLHLITAGVL